MVNCLPILKFNKENKKTFVLVNRMKKNPHNNASQTDEPRPSQPLLAQSLRRYPYAPVPTGQALRASFAAYSGVIRPKENRK
jgi:hypothetical protein